MPREGCEAIHAADPRSLCVVGPRPYYKLWELSDQVLQPSGSNTLYTFDFFVPKNFVMSDSSKSGARFPSSWRCKVCCATLPLTTRMQTLMPPPLSRTPQDIYDSWWKGKRGCSSSTSTVYVDESWLRRTIENFAVGFATRHNVPVHCNQWGVKDEVYDSNGRQQYARAMLNLFSEHKISSTYWLWRSYKKEGRDVTEPVWGFELTHNDGPHEALDEGMLSTLQEGFVKTARANSGNLYPCGAAAAGVDAGFEVAPLDGTAEAKALTLAQQPPVRFATPPLSTNSGDSGVECDPLMLEMRIDWSLLEPSSSTAGTPKRTVDWPAPPGMLPAGASTVAPPSPELWVRAAPAT